MWSIAWNVAIEKKWLTVYWQLSNLSARFFHFFLMTRIDQPYTWYQKCFFDNIIAQNLRRFTDIFSIIILKYVNVCCKYSKPAVGSICKCFVNRQSLIYNDININWEWIICLLTLSLLRFSYFQCNISYIWRSHTQNPATAYFPTESFIYSYHYCGFLCGVKK